VVSFEREERGIVMGLPWWVYPLAAYGAYKFAKGFKTGYSRSSRASVGSSGGGVRYKLGYAKKARS
jgi:hypothetical protein